MQVAMGQVLYFKFVSVPGKKAGRQDIVLNIANNPPS